MVVAVIFSFSSIEAIIADGNDKFAYKVILRDTDADASIQIM